MVPGETDRGRRALPLRAGRARIVARFAVVDIPRTVWNFKRCVTR
ncbi:MAG: hypothetical protein ACYDCK_12965 [Thermoplasmatota archaeon]